MQGLSGGHLPLLLSQLGLIIRFSKGFSGILVANSIDLLFRTGHSLGKIHLSWYRTNPSLQKHPSMHSFVSHASNVAPKSDSGMNLQADIHFVPHFWYIAFSNPMHSSDFVLFELIVAFAGWICWYLLNSIKIVTSSSTFTCRHCTPP